MVPGVLITLFYFIFAPLLITWGFSPMFTLSLAIVLVLVPIQMGLLIFLKDKVTNTSCFRSILSQQTKVKPATFAFYVIILIVFAGLILLLLSSTLNDWLKNHMFSFMPIWARNSELQSSEPQRTITILSLFVFGNLIGPLVEEMYFRGFLIHRVHGSVMQKSIANAFLFALYHFWSPWDIISRTIAVTPHAWITLKTNNIWISVFAHISINMLFSMPLLSMIL